MLAITFVMMIFSLTIIQIFVVFVSSRILVLVESKIYWNFNRHFHLHLFRVCVALLLCSEQEWRPKFSAEMDFLRRHLPEFMADSTIRHPRSKTVFGNHRKWFLFSFLTYIEPLHECSCIDAAQITVVSFRSNTEIFANWLLNRTPSFASPKSIFKIVFTKIIEIIIYAPAFRIRISPKQ